MENMKKTFMKDLNCNLLDVYNQALMILIIPKLVFLLGKLY